MLYFSILSIFLSNTEDHLPNASPLPKSARTIIFLHCNKESRKQFKDALSWNSIFQNFLINDIERFLFLDYTYQSKDVDTSIYIEELPYSSWVDEAPDRFRIWP